VNQTITRMSVADEALHMARRARQAQHHLQAMSEQDRTAGIRAAADMIAARQPQILAANAQDLDKARAAGRDDAFLDRLALTPARLESIVGALREVADSTDPIGETIEAWSPPNGIDIRQVRIPIGVLAVIFESRPNVTADAAALALRSGNAVILRGGSDGFASGLALVSAIRDALDQAGLPPDLVQHPQTTDRDFVGALLTGLDGHIDLVIPRGGRDLVQRVQSEARVAVLGHLDGICHAYVDASADADMARALVINSKMRRTGVCNAVECLLIDQSRLDDLWPLIGRDLAEAGCEIRADERARAVWPDAIAADEADWGREFLDAVIAVRTVDGLDDALAHIRAFGSGHTDLIIGDDAQTTERFLNSADSAVVMANATTGFSDGGEFGFGAEIGIATSRLHARGPVGARQLTTYKYQVRGQGQVRG
jgi:glutamate-5-semialdehyde dehydrogenase